MLKTIGDPDLCALDWSKILAEYEADLAHGGHRALTQKSVLSSLKPWVEHLEESQREPSSLLLKEYLLTKNYSHSSYNKVGSDIVKFSNSYTEDTIRLIKPTGKLKVIGKVQMVEANI